jgi:hypothetical protein
MEIVAFNFSASPTQQTHTLLKRPEREEKEKKGKFAAISMEGGINNSKS